MSPTRRSRLPVIVFCLVALARGVLAGPTAIHGVRGELIVRAPSAHQWRQVDAVRRAVARQAERGGGGAISGLETTQVLYRAPAFGQPSAEGNVVLIQWFEDGTETGPVSVRLNGETLCTVPPLGAAGTNACVVAGLPSTCRPDFDAGCVPNLEGEFQCRVPEGSVFNAHIFEIVLGGGESLRQCQEVVDTWPFGSNMFFAYRTRAAATLATSLTSGNCNESIDLPTATVNCALAAEAGETDIIITGNNGGPPATFLDVYLDGGEGLHIEEPAELFCFDRTLPVPTRGEHELRFEGFLSRPQASETFWFNPETNQSYGGIVGAFFGLSLTTRCVTTTAGRPQAPADLMLRQTAYGGGDNAVRASWRNAERPYPGGVRVAVDGKSFATLDGSAEAALLTGLANGRRAIGVRGDGAAAGLSDEARAEIAVRSSTPFPNQRLPVLECAFDLAANGTARLSWTGGDPLDWIDVLRRRSGSAEPTLVALIPGDAGRVTLTGVARGDVLSLELLRQDSGSLYAVGRLECAAPADAGRQLPGDVNQDRQLNITDAVGLLVILFQGARGVPVPCEGAVDARGAEQLLDWDGNRTVNLTDAVGMLRFLFLGDQPHALGAACVAVEGCPARCR